MLPTNQNARRAPRERNEPMSALGGVTLFISEVHTDFPSVAAEGGCFAVRCVSSLNGPARGKAKGKSGLADQRGPRFSPCRSL